MHTVLSDQTESKRLTDIRPDVAASNLLQFPRLHSSPQQIEVTSERHFDSHAASFRALADIGAAAPFAYLDWQSAYLEALEPDALSELLVAHADSNPLAYVQLVSERSRMYGVPIRLMRPPVPMMSPDVFDIVVDPAHEETVLAAFWDHLGARRDWDVIELVDLPHGGPGWRLADRAREHGFSVGQRLSREMAYIDLPAGATTIDALPNATTAKFRANVRRRMRNLQKQGEVRLIRTPVYDDAVLDKFFALEHAGWKGRNGTSILSDPKIVRYYRSIARLAASHGQLALYSLECDGNPVAMHFGIMVNNRYSVPKLAFSERHPEFAPGHLLVHEVLEDLLQRGCLSFDFLGDAQAWKREWTQEFRTCHRLHIFNKTSAGHVAYGVRYGLLPLGRRLERRTQDALTSSTAWYQARSRGRRS